MLLYPTNASSSEIKETDFVVFHETPNVKMHYQCSLGKISIFKDGRLDENIGEKILSWFKINE